MIPTPGSVLVRMPTWVGDVVMATPALRSLKTAWPDARLLALCRSPADRLLRSHPRVDEVIVVDPKEERGAKGAWRLSRRLAKEGFDVAVLLANSFTSALPCFLARIPVRVGYSGDWRGPLLTHRVKPRVSGRSRVPIPMPLYYQQILDEVGVAGSGPSYELVSTPDAEDEVERRLSRLGVSKNERLLGISPGARFGASKLWPSESFAEVVAALGSRGIRSLLICAKDEQDLCVRIAERAGPSAIPATDEPFELELLPAVMKRLGALVTTDSGPRHIGTWAGLPVVVVMGPTHPGWTHWNMQRTVVIRHDVPCGPCHLKVCPTDHACMHLNTPAEVVAALEGLWPECRASV